MCFDFLVNFAVLFYYAFYKQDFNQLSTSFTSIMITKNTLRIITREVIPYIMYKIKHVRFEKKWRDERIIRKKELMIKKGLEEYIDEHRVNYGSMDEK